jgi:hypothetical protein
MHWTTRIGVAGVVLCVGVIASLNVVGWLNTLPGFPGVAAAIVALGLELIAFVSLEHVFKYWTSRDWGRLLLAVIGLAFAAGWNIEGGHRGVVHLAAPLYASAEADRRVVQGALDTERAALQADIAERQGRIDAVAATNPGVTYPGRMAEWRANFDIVTADDRRAVAQATARLNALAITAIARAPFPRWLPYAVTTAFAFWSIFGLTMFGVKVAHAPAPTKRRTPAPKVAPKPGAPKLAVNNEAPKKHGQAQRAGALLKGAAAGTVFAILPGLPGPAHAAAPLVAWPAQGPDRALSGPSAGRPANLAENPRDKAKRLIRAGVAAKEATRQTGVPYTTTKRWKQQIRGGGA